MRYIILFLSFCQLTNIISQDWMLVSASIKSVFTKADYPTPLACFSIDSVNQINNDTTIYYNYQLYGENTDYLTDYSSCQGMGTPCYIISNKMSWLGRKIINIDNNWIFITENNDSLKFNFSQLDTVTIFENGNRKLQTVYINDTVKNLYGTLDSIKTYKILQYDASDNLIQDKLLNKTIRLSKHFGLLDFIEVRNYPDSIAYYSIVGCTNGNDTVGKTTIKKYEIHQSEVGTITQFENKRETYYTCCPTEHPGYYFLETYETIGSSFSGENYIMTYLKNEKIVDSLVIDTNLISYNIPFIRNVHNQVIKVEIDSTSCYGKGYYVTTSYSDCNFYCPTFDCYSITSAQNGGYCIYYDLSSKPNIQSVLSVFNGNPPTNIPETERNLKYTLVNGTSCGIRGYSDINKTNKDKRVVFPNPARDEIFIKEISSKVSSIQIKDSNGKIIKTIYNQVESIDISSLSEGVYFIEIKTVDKKIVNTFIKQ